MKILVMGGSGFLGSHVADALTDAGHTVRIFDAVVSPYLRAGQEMITGDVRDGERLAAAVRGCAVVYNFAAIADIADAHADPVGAVEVNVFGNLRALEACRRHGVERYVFASTIYVYSDRGSFYRCSKQACELFIEEYQRQYGLGYTILRYGSLYGPRADDRNWIHSILRQALNEGKIVRAGDGEELREYIHVLDAAANSVRILAPEYASQAVTLTGGNPIKIKDLLVMVREMMENRITIEFVPGSDPAHYEMTPYVFRPRAAKKMVANPYVDLGQGLLEYLYLLDRERQNPGAGA